mgnify:FL=1
MNDAYKIEYSTVDKSKQLAIPLAIVGAWALVQTIFCCIWSTENYLSLAIFAWMTELILLVTFISTRKYKVSVSEQRIVVQTLFRKRTIEMKDVLICKILDKSDDTQSYRLEMHGDKVEITISAQDVNRFEELLTMYNIQQTPETADINYKKSRSIVGACLVVLFAVLLLCKDGICSILGIDQTSKFGDLAISAILFLPLFVAMFLFGKNLLAKKRKGGFVICLLAILAVLFFISHCAAVFIVGQ